MKKISRLCRVIAQTVLMAAAATAATASGLLPAVAIAVPCHSVFWRELGLFRFFFSFGQRLLFMLFGDEHVERRNNEKSENRSNRHAAHQHQTDGISRGRAGPSHQGQREVTGDGGHAGHHDRSQSDPSRLSDSSKFRHALPLRGGHGASLEQLEDLLDAAVSECERFYPAFQSVIWGGMNAESALAAAMFDVAGEA